MNFMESKKGYYFIDGKRVSEDKYYHEEIKANINGARWHSLGYDKHGNWHKACTF